MQNLNLIARLDSYEPDGYYAHIESIKGMGESGKTPEEAVKELLISLKVKLAYDNGLEIDALKKMEIAPFKLYKIELREMEEKGYTEFTLPLMEARMLETA